MADKHFQGHNPDWDHIKPNKEIESNLLVSMFTEFICVDRLRLAFEGFKAKRSPGSDGLPPLALKHLPQETINHKVIICKAALALSYTPL